MLRSFPPEMRLITESYRMTEGSFIHSFVHLQVVVDPRPILETLRMSKEYTLDGILII